MLSAMTEMWKNLVESSEGQEQTLGQVRDMISEALVKKDEMDTKELLVVIMQAQHSLLTAQQVQQQQQNISLKQMMSAMEGPLKELEDEMNKLRGENPFGTDEDPFGTNGPSDGN